MMTQKIALPLLILFSFYIVGHFECTTVESTRYLDTTKKKNKKQSHTIVIYRWTSDLLKYVGCCPIYFTHDPKARRVWLYLICFCIITWHVLIVS